MKGIFKYGVIGVCLLCIVGVAVLILSATPAYAPDYAPDKADYVKYIGSSVGLTQAYSEYHVCNPTLTDISVASKSKSSFNWYFTQTKGILTDSWIERLQNVSYTDSCYSGNHLEASDVSIKDNKTASSCKDIGCADGKDAITCSCSNLVNDYKDCTQYKSEWQKWNPTDYAKANKCFNIRVVGTYAPAFRTAIKVDNVIEFAGNNYDEYAWWDTQFNKRRNITLTNTTAMDTDYPVVATGLSITDICSIRVVDANSNPVNVFGFQDDGDADLESNENLTFRASSWDGRPYSVYYAASPTVSCANSSWNDARYAFWDNFDDNSINTTKWTVVGDEVWESSGVLHIAGDGAWFSDGVKAKMNGGMDRTNTGYVMQFKTNRDSVGGVDVYVGVGYTNFNNDGWHMLLNIVPSTSTAYTAGTVANGMQSRILGGGATSDAGVVNTISWNNIFYLYANKTQGFVWVLNNTILRNADTTDADNMMNFTATQYVNGANGTIDDVYISKYMTAEPTYSIGAEEVNTLPTPVIAIASPANSSTISNSQLLNWTATSQYNTTFNCTDYLDSTPYSWGNVTNNTYNSRTLGLNENTHVIQVNCTDSAGTGTKSVTFTNAYFDGTAASASLQYSATQQELSSYLYNVTYTNTSNVTNIATSLNWNNTIITANKSGNTHSAYYLVPLLSSNNSLLNPTFNATITYNNGTTQTWSSSVMPIAMFYSYNYTGMTNKANATEEESVTFTSTYWNSTNLATLSQSALFNGTNYAGTLNGVITNTISMPAVSSMETKAINGSLTVSYGGRSRIMTANSSIGIYPLNITAGDGTPSLRFSCYDELTLLPVNCSANAVFYAWSGSANRNFTFNYTTPTNEVVLNITPAWMSFLANASMDYKNDGLSYGQREFYIIGSTISNSTQNISLYMLNTTYSSIITFTLKNENAKYVSDAIIKVYRFYKENNTYRLVAMGRTGSGGTVPIRLQLVDATYKYEAWQGGVLLGSFADEQLVSVNKELKLSAAPLANFFSVFGKLSGTCNINSTKYLNCWLIDTSGKVSASYLDVWERSSVNITSKICGLSGTPAAPNLTCYMTSYPNYTYYYDYYATYNGGKFTIDSATVGGQQTAIFGALGFFVAILIVFGMALSGYWNPVVAITLGIVGMIMSTIMGFLPLAESAIVSIICVGAVLIYKMRS